LYRTAPALMQSAVSSVRGANERAIALYQGAGFINSEESL